MKVGLKMAVEKRPPQTDHVAAQHNISVNLPQSSKEKQVGVDTLDNWACKVNCNPIQLL
jgi:hypothetical protein